MYGSLLRLRLRVASLVTSLAASLVASLVTPLLAASSLALGPACGDGAAPLESGASALLSIGPGNMNAADWNGDSLPDLSVANFLSANFAVRLNAGTDQGPGGATFQESRLYPAGLFPSFIAAADFNHDNRLDAAVVNAVSNDVSVLLGKGDGSFLATRQYPLSDPRKPLLGLGLGPFSMVARDFNHDQHPDIVTNNSLTNNVSVLLGTGTGTFQAAKTYPLLGPKSLGLVPFALATADFDGDGNYDLAAGALSSVVILKGRADGSFTAVREYMHGIDTACVDVADFDGDGKMDIAATATVTNSYTILLGRGDGSFTIKETRPAGGTAPQCFSIGDLDGDQKLDLAIVNTASASVGGAVAVLLGKGDGTFAQPVAYPVGILPWASAMVDFNHDGNLDVAACNAINSSVSVLLGNGDGTLQPQIMVPM
ncbi:MAG: VCBS repeat-containing protein [Polyangia bacterium]